MSPKKRRTLGDQGRMRERNPLSILTLDPFHDTAAAATDSCFHCEFLSLRLTNPWGEVGMPLSPHPANMPPSLIVPNRKALSFILSCRLPTRCQQQHLHYNSSSSNNSSSSSTAAPVATALSRSSAPFDSTSRSTTPSTPRAAPYATGCSGQSGS